MFYNVYIFLDTNASGSIFITNIGSEPLLRLVKVSVELVIS